MIAQILIAAAAAALVTLVLAFLLIRYIPNDRVGIVERLVSSKGSLSSGFIALHGEAGFQPDVLRGGAHVLPRFLYRVHRVQLVTIPQGHVGYVFARDGGRLEPTQVLASNASTADFSDTRAFLQTGGQRGPQRAILREGTHAINLAQFIVVTDERVYGIQMSASERAMFEGMAKLIQERQGFTPVVIHQDVVGIVTVHDGPPLEHGEIVAPALQQQHSSFQDAERFLAAGGRRGRQLEVLVEGTYYVNRLFATVELVPKTVIEVGTVGVVVSYVGEIGADLSGEDYKHGETVEQGMRGVWSRALMPGKYAFNTFAGRIVAVPTTNIILKWIRNETGSHRLDENLSEVSLITKDAFEPHLPLSVVLHVDYRKAPLVVQRFGDIRRLIEQTLDPMVAAYFKNVGQTRTLIELLQDRSEIQRQASVEMREKFARYSLELEEVLIGTPTSGGDDGRIEDILKQLRARQIATEQIETYHRQQDAAVEERMLREAEARARQQTEITESELSVVVLGNKGRADYHRALQQAEQVRALASADADRIRFIAEADADRAARVGIAQAVATEEQVRALGGPQFQVARAVMERLAEAVEKSGAEVVPRIVVGGAGGASAGLAGMLETLMTLLMSEKMGTGELAEADPEVTAMRRRLRREVVAERKAS